MSNWYLIHTKIRQERVALENIERQGFECFLPQINAEKLRRGALQVVQEALVSSLPFHPVGQWAGVAKLGTNSLNRWGEPLGHFWPNSSKDQR